MVTRKIEHIVAELIRMSDAELVWEEYSQALFDIFSQESVLKAVAILNAETSLIDLTLHKDYHNILEMYDRLERKKALMQI